MNAPCELDAGIEQFKDVFADERHRTLVSFINSQVGFPQSPEAQTFFERVQTNMEAGEMPHTWMRLALAGDAAALLASVKTFTTELLDNETEYWAEAQIDSGNWINLLRDYSQQ